MRQSSRAPASIGADLISQGTRQRKLELVSAQLRQVLGRGGLTPRR